MAWVILVIAGLFEIGHRIEVRGGLYAPVAEHLDGAGDVISLGCLA